MKYVLLFSLAFSIGCAHHIVYQSREDFHNQVESDMNKIPFYSMGKEIGDIIIACTKFAPGSKKAKACFDEASSIGMAKINLLYPHSDESQIRNYFIVNKKMARPKIVTNITKSNDLKEDVMMARINKPAGEFIIVWVDIIYYEFLARTSEAFNREEILYNRHVAYVSNYNASVDAQNARMGQALHNLNTQMQINDLQRQQTNQQISIQNRLNGGINTPYR